MAEYLEKHNKNSKPEPTAEDSRMNMHSTAVEMEEGIAYAQSRYVLNR
jgi:hypothetical protein